MAEEDNERLEGSGDPERMEITIQKEISKLEYYLEGTEELIRVNDIEEIKTTVKQSSKIAGKLSELISQLEESKIDSGIRLELFVSGKRTPRLNMHGYWKTKRDFLTFWSLESSEYRKNLNDESGKPNNN